MVEAQLGEPILRARTPTQGRCRSYGRFPGPDDPDLKLHRPSRNSPAISTETIIAEDTGTSGGDIDIPDSMHGDDSRSQMSDSSRPDPANASSNRRRSRSHLTNPQRPFPSPHPSQPSSSRGYAIPSPTSSSENIHNRPPTGFQGSSPHYSPSPVSYPQMPGYVGQYTISPQPGPMTMVHPATPYGFLQTYHPPGVPDNSMTTQSMHANYQPMLQPHAPVYSYQGPSPDGGSSFSGTRASPMYPPHQANPASSSTSPHMSSSSSQSSALPTSYIGTGFQSLRYPSPMSSTPYPYPTQAYQASPLYQAQYHYGQHYTPPSETDPQGTWFYLPHATPVPSPRQYDAGPLYYPPASYPRIVPPDDGPYGIAPPVSSANPSAHIDAVSPSLQRFTQYVEDHTASDSPRASGAGPPAALAAASASSGSTGVPIIGEKPKVRRSYHPNPPAHRSEWVMWAGNVPSDATHDELWRFFNQPLDGRVGGGGGSDGTQAEDTIPSPTGVMSIFLISRSSCAFVNYENEEHLHEAINRFNGVPLRANDPRCARLVCRVRRKDDDLKAGVGGQRGIGMHTRYIREQKGKAKEVPIDPSDMSASDEVSTSPTSISGRLAAAISTTSISSDEGERRGVHVKHSSSSGSYTSTNSSFLARHFPKRYFILKSLTQSDLDLSVQTGLWATQKHNEEILDQAFRTSKEVYLIFGVNKSGEFFGYARMSGPVRRGEQRVSWTSRSSQSPPSRPPQSPLSHPAVTPSAKPPQTFFSPSDRQLVDTSPLPVDGASPIRLPGPRAHTSAPALLGGGYRLPTVETPKTRHSLDQRMQVELATRRNEPSMDFALDATAPLRAIRGKQQGGKSVSQTLGSVEEADEARHGQEEEETMKAEDSWGDSFAVEWLCLERLPFPRTRHLRNPWNHDREVKVSRDGTELEPSVGQRLLEEWDKLASEPQAPPTSSSAGPGKPSGGRRAGGGARNVAGSGAVLGSPEGEAPREGTTKGGPLRS